MIPHNILNQPELWNPVVSSDSEAADLSSFQNLPAGTRSDLEKIAQFFHTEHIRIPPEQLRSICFFASLSLGFQVRPSIFLQLDFAGCLVQLITPVCAVLLWGRSDSKVPLFSYKGKSAIPVDFDKSQLFLIELSRMKSSGQVNRYPQPYTELGSIGAQ